MAPISGIKSRVISGFEIQFLIMGCGQSNFGPADEKKEAVQVTSIQGEIPRDFAEGVYIRNGWSFTLSIFTISIHYNSKPRHRLGRKENLENQLRVLYAILSPRETSYKTPTKNIHQCLRWSHLILYSIILIF